MVRQKSESGQALILIVFAIVALIGLTGLAIDGGNAYSDRRNAQNAADTAAMAGALLSSSTNGAASNTAITNASSSRATSNGYDGVTNNTVNVTITAVPSGGCPFNANGQDVQVDIVSNVSTYFARVMGFTQFTNKVTATARSCYSTIAPLFNGNAIVGLGKTGQDFNGIGTPDWNIKGGGIFSNSSSAASAYCNGAAGVTAPSVTAVGSLNSSSFTCQTVSIPGGVTGGATQYNWSDYQKYMPPTPACDGTAYQAGGQWYTQTGADGSKVALTGGDMNFTAGLYCITNNPGPYHGTITGANGVTFYVMSPNFSLTFNGHGSINASAPTTGTYAGVLMYMAPQTDANGDLVQTQTLDLMGNGTASVTGTIIAPSADVNVYGNSGPNNAYDSQIIGYSITSGGNSNININYNKNDNYQDTVSASVQPLR